MIEKKQYTQLENAVARLTFYLERECEDPDVIRAMIIVIEAIKNSNLVR